MFKEILQLKLFTAVILIVIGFFVISVIKLEPSLSAVRKELKNLNQKIDEAEKSSLELEKLGDYLKSDVYLERQARLKLNYKKPDEKVVFVYDTEDQNEREMPKYSKKLKIFESNLTLNIKSWWDYLIDE